MLGVIQNKEFEPNPAEHLIAAFKVLDPENKGYIKKEIMQELMGTKGINLRPREMEYFLNYAEDKSGQFIYYEDYVQRMIKDQERHKEELIKEYETFKIPG